MPDSPSSTAYPILSTISSPKDVKALSPHSCELLADELRRFIVETVSRTGGHLGSNLGAVELTIAMHRAFNSPQDVLLFDTGHQSYVHKLLTGRMAGFEHLRQEDGLSGYPSRAESEHDIIENSHASTALSYAYGIAAALSSANPHSMRRVVALVGDGALTGGMAYEALNNLGHSASRVLVVLNDNGRSYAPTVSKLSESLTQIRLHSSYSAVRTRINRLVGELPGIGNVASQSLRHFTSALRELVEPHVFFEALGIRYAGPIDGHDIAATESALRKAAAYPGPIVLHVLTRKGKGYGPAEQDEVQCLHDLKAQAHGPTLSAPGSSTDHGAVSVRTNPPETSYTEAFSKAVLRCADNDPSVVAMTAAMPGPVGLLAFEARYPDRFFDVGIAEQHALTSATGMALFGLKPVVAVYSTFLSRAFDQANLDMGLHGAGVVLCIDRAGITGDDGPSHHGILDMVLALAIPGVSVFAPSEPAEIDAMLETALSLGTPALIRYPKTPGAVGLGERGAGLSHRVLREEGNDVVLIGVGKMASACLEASELLGADGVHVTVIDPRVVRPVDPALVDRVTSARVVLTVEDGLIQGGAGQFLRAVIEHRAAEIGVVSPTVVNFGIETGYISHGRPEAILHRLGLDGEGIASSTRAALCRADAESIEIMRAVSDIGA